MRSAKWLCVLVIGCVFLQVKLVGVFPVEKVRLLQDVWVKDGKLHVKVGVG